MRDHPRFPQGFAGGLLADCHAGYDAVQAASDNRIVRAACVAHARRKVFAARSNHPVHASVLLAMFQELYDIEDRVKQLLLAERLALRQSESQPIWERMRECMASDAIGNVMPKEPFGQALTYLRNQFDHLLVHLSNGGADDESLRPDVWKAAHPEAVRVYRVESVTHGPTPNPAGPKSARKEAISSPGYS